jgi:DNA-binding CsgD family transcriptional regulator
MTAMPELAGREAELAVLSGVLERLKVGRGRAVLLEGEAGIGKSSLVAASLAGSADQIRVLTGTCDELSQRFPLSAVRQMLGSGAASGPGAQTAPGAVADPVHAAVEELVGVAETLCTDGPLVLVLEDLHWADEASVLWWRRLCRLTGQLPLALLGTRRLVPRAPGADGLRRQVEADSGVVLPLGALAPGAVQMAAAALIGGVPGPRLLGWLGHAGGNPFYLRELIDEASRQGRLQTVRGVTDLTEDAAGLGEDGGAPTDDAVLARAAVESRLDFLSGDALRVLRIAALLGPEFMADDLAAICEQSPAALLPVLEDALAGGVLEESGVQLRFRHGLLRQALYGGIASPVRAGLHQQAAQALAGQGAPAGRVAQQLLAIPALAGGTNWEADWLAGQAEELVRRVPVVAAELLARSLRKMRPDDANRSRLEDQLLESLFILGRYEQTVQLAEHVRPTVSDPDRDGRATWLHTYALQRLRRHADAAAVLAAVGARPDVDPVWQARFSALRAMVTRSLGEPAEARRHATTALAAGRELGDSNAIGYALHALAVQHADDHDFEGGCRLIDEALPVAERDPGLGDLWTMLVYNRASWGAQLGGYEEARKLALDALARGELSGSPRLRRLHGLVAGIAYETGAWDQALAELDASTGTGVDEHLDDAPYLRALIAGHREEGREAESELAAVRLSTDGYAPPAGQTVRHLAADIAALAVLDIERSGEPEAAAVLLRWLERDSEATQPFFFHLSLPSFVRLLLAAGNEPGAGAAAAGAEREAVRDPLARKQAAARWCRGLVSSDPASVLAAAASLRDQGLTLAAGGAFEDAAVLLAGAGNAVPGRAALEDALLLYSRIGASWDARRAVSRVRPFGIRPGVRGPRGRPKTGWAALSETERRVAELVAAGCSNPDIAGQLFISRRTVESHVSHILGKLQVASRWDVRIAAQQAANRGRRA